MTYDDFAREFYDSTLKMLMENTEILKRAVSAGLDPEILMSMTTVVIARAEEEHTRWMTEQQ